MKDTGNLPPENTLEARFFWFKKLRTMIVFSLVINLLYLTGPIFMMQVYDRVLASANIPTLVGLTIIVVLLYVFFGVLEYIRGQALRAHGEIIADSLSQKAYLHSVLNNCEKKPTAEKKQALGDVGTLRSFLVSPPFSAFFDLPWAPIFLLVIFALHPGLGIFSIIACLLLAVLASINERLSREHLKKATGMTTQTSVLAQNAQRNAVTLRGNGMIDTMGQQWRESDLEARKASLHGGSINASFSTTTKTLRMMIQSLILGLGAYYVIKGELSAGSIIACTVIFSRALAPFEQILGNYSSLVNARDSWENIKTWLFEKDTDGEQAELPDPQKAMLVHELHVMAPNDNSAFIIKNVQFALHAGDVLGITGPSGSGKSTLAKALVGAWPAAKGKICLDGAELQQWSRLNLGKHIGYLPQDIELFDGTVAENIARFRDDSNFDKVLAASELAGTHELILELKDGYNTRVGPEGMALSSGQQQRVALARALYDSPFMIVMDEPNSNLDAEGEKILNETISKLQQRKAIVVFISHRPFILEKANKILIMQKGEMKAFGAPSDIVAQSKGQQQGPLPRASKPSNTTNNIKDKIQRHTKATYGQGMTTFSSSTTPKTK